MPDVEESTEGALFFWMGRQSFGGWGPRATLGCFFAGALIFVEDEDVTCKHWLLLELSRPAVS
jgi:hypothetical protein